MGIIQSVVFSDWLLPPNENVQFLCVFSWLDGSFPFSTNIPLSECTAVYASIYLLKEALVASESGYYE